jgi:hypothetical protein
MGRRSFWLVALALIALITVAVAVPSDAETGWGAASAAPPPLPPVQSVTDLGNVQQNPVIHGRDGIMSGLFQGKSVWAFGDTPLSVPGRDGDSWSDNTLSWTSDLDASDGLALTGDHLDSTGAPTEYLPLTRAERRYNRAHDGDNCQTPPCNAEFALWSGTVIPDEARNRLLLPYIEIHRIIGEPGWTNVGGGIAVWTPGQRVVRPITNPGSQTPTLMWPDPEIQFNAGWTEIAETLYAYGCYPGFLVQHCQVARVALADVLDESKWQYFAGSGTWSSDPADAVTVFDGGAAGSTVLYSKYHGLFLAIYNGVFDDDLFYRASRTPWGPWSDQALLFTARPGWNGEISYAGEAHYELAQQDGKVQYVTYAHPIGFLRWDIPLVKVVFGPPAS